MNSVTLKAIRISRVALAVRNRLQAAPRDAGRVHSVFDRVVNLTWHDGRLITLQGPGRLGAPFALELPRLPDLERLTPGDPVWRTGDALELGDVTIQWRGAVIAETGMPDAGVRPPAAVRLANDVPGVPAPALSSAIGLAGRARLADGIARHRSDLFLDGARTLIGLGEGLTPAGDDCLVGSLAVLHRHDRAWLRAHPEMRASLRTMAKHGTTSIAAEFIVHALDGHFAETVIDVLTSADAVARHAVMQLCRVGATSGADTLCGMRLALETLGARMS